MSFPKYIRLDEQQKRRVPPLHGLQTVALCPPADDKTQAPKTFSFKGSLQKLFLSLLLLVPFIKA